MTGSALMDFLIALVMLIVIVGLIFLALDKISPDDFFKKIARFAVGGAALILALIALKGVFFGGGGSAIAVSPVALLSFAIGLIVLMVVLYLVYLAIDYFMTGDVWKGRVTPVKYIIGAIAIIVILYLAQQALLGGGSMQFQRLLR